MRNKTGFDIKRNIAVSIILGIVVLLILFGFIAGGIGYNQFSEKFTEEYSVNAYRVAEAASSYIDAAKLTEYLKTEGSTEEYQQTREALQTLCDKVGCEFIYVIQPDLEDYGHITFVFNIVNKDSGFEAYPTGFVKETTNDEYKQKYRRMYEEKSEEEIVVRDKGFIETGSHITAMKTLHNSYGSPSGILCVQRQMDALTKARNEYLIRVFYAVAALIVIISLIYAFFLHRLVIDPLRTITHETERFSSRPSEPEKQLSELVKTKNEIGKLAHSVDMMERDTLAYIENLTKMTAEQQRIGTELEVASAIQQSMLNSVRPDRNEFDIAASMTPAKEVGGDFYDFFMVDDDHLAMVMADVSGKGVPAALFMMVSKIVIADSTLVYRSPAEILAYVNERICKKNTLDMFVTVWLGILEISTGIVTACNAGHEYPVIGRNGKGFSLLTDNHGFVIGGMSGMKYKDYTFKLDPGDSVFLYTDGVAEATDGEERLFGTDRLLAALNKSPQSSPQELIEHVIEDVDRFVGDAPQFDDMTMMCVRYAGKQDAGA